MTYTAQDVLSFVEENDVQFIRLAFCDPFGVQKNISIMPSELKSAFDHGVSFDSFSIKVFLNKEHMELLLFHVSFYSFSIKGFLNQEHMELLLFPDPNTLSMLPWRPSPGSVVRFYCDVKTSKGEFFYGDSRQVLKKASARCRKMGYVSKIGVESEFYLFKTDENGEPTKTTIDNGTYLDIAPLDKGENIRREICLCLQEMELQPETSCHEYGPGQNEIDFKHNTILKSADDLLSFKSVVRAIAARSGLFASFMPKPLPNESGSGLHINISLHQQGQNLFKDPGKASIMESFLAGILARAAEMTLFLNPIINSYDRFGEYEAPKYVSWSQEGRSQLLRIPVAADGGRGMELRSPDPSLNPYLAFALILHAGLDGIEQRLTLPPAAEANLNIADSSVTDSLELLPTSLNEAIELAENSEFVKKYLDEQLLNAYVQAKKVECEKFVECGDKQLFYDRNYFRIM